MIRAACHCTTVRFELQALPAFVLDCNCTICRRYGALWAYPKPDEVKRMSAAGTDTYVWGDREIAFHRCSGCGCVTHTASLDEDRPRIYSVNARMIATLDPETVPLRQIDNGHTGVLDALPRARFSRTASQDRETRR